MEEDSRSLVSQSIMKVLLNPNVVEEEVAEVAEVEDSVQEGSSSGDLDATPFWIPCDGNIRHCEDSRQVKFSPSDE